ncbi:hypothetical protein E2K80_15275 [Rhodophyticola sp. CCM32]|nr:hypothetical protein E2K80_15275 [Rhodophyticola sp. CCM32]
MAKLGPVLEHAFQTLLHGRPARGEDETDLIALRDAARHNGALIAATLDGFKSANALLAPASARSFTGYDALGRSSEIGTARPCVEQRS